MPIQIKAYVIAPWTTRARLTWPLLKFILILLSPWHDGAEMEIRGRS